MALADEAPPASSFPHPTPSPHPLLLAGPTGVGKSAVALRLAERLGGEIISVDSMQVYRGLDLGTAKPTPAERGRVPHHLIDVLDLTERFDAARFAALAHRAVEEIQARGRIPILCGGTGLYFRAFLEGLGDAPPADAALRAELERTPLPILLRELAERDPDIFARIDRQNPRRIVRALEVIRLTGRPYSVQRAKWSAPAPLVPRPWPLFLGLARTTDDLRTRIDARVEEMFRRGLVQETASLLRQGLARNRTALQAIGYRQVVAHLRGEHSLADTITLVKQRTRQFAKRQMTWFRRQADLIWIAAKPHDDAGALAEQVMRIRAGSENGDAPATASEDE